MNVAKKIKNHFNYYLPIVIKNVVQSVDPNGFSLKKQLKLRIFWWLVT